MDDRLRGLSMRFRRRYYRMRKKKTEEELIKELNKQDSKSWLWEFTKKILAILTVLYCIERFYVMWIMIRTGNFNNLDTFIETGADVFKAGVIFYAVKAGIENVFKIGFENKNVNQYIVGEDELEG